MASTVGPLPESLLYVAPLLNKVPATRRPRLAASLPLRRPLVGNSFPMALCHGVASVFATAPRPASRSAAAPGQQHLPDGSSLQRPCQQQLCHGAPASNKPHLAEKNTPVWLAIWRTWAGFANSQLLPDAAAGAPSRALSAESPVERQLFRTDFRFAPSLPQRFACGPLPFTRTWSSTVCAEELPTPREMPVSLNCCCSDTRKSFGPPAPIAYATSVSPPNEAAAWAGAQVSDG